MPDGRPTAGRAAPREDARGLADDRRDPNQRSAGATFFQSRLRSTLFILHIATIPQSPVLKATDTAVAAEKEGRLTIAMHAEYESQQPEFAYFAPRNVLAHMSCGEPVPVNAHEPTSAAALLALTCRLSTVMSRAYLLACAPSHSRIIGDNGRRSAAITSHAASALSANQRGRQCNSSE